jgi:hypothetical protein
MSEYIEIEPIMTDDPAVILLHTNLRLTDNSVEEYASPEAMSEGSAVAQALAPIEGIVQLFLDEQDLTIRRALGVPQHLIISEVSAALREFFL